MNLLLQLIKLIEQSFHVNAAQSWAWQRFLEQFKTIVVSPQLDRVMNGHQLYRCPRRTIARTTGARRNAAEAASSTSTSRVILLALCHKPLSTGISGRLISAVSQVTGPCSASVFFRSTRDIGRTGHHTHDVTSVAAVRGGQIRGQAPGQITNFTVR